MHAFDVKHNGECGDFSQLPNSLSTAENSSPNEPRAESPGGDAEGMLSSIQAQLGACAAILALADDDRLTSTQYRVFALIGKGYQKRADIAGKIGKTVVTVARAIDRLVSLRLIERETVKGKPSKLRISGHIIDAARIIGDTTKSDTRIAGDTPTRIADATSATNDTTTRITNDTTNANDTGQNVENFGAPISTGARAETLNLNTSTDQIRSDQIAPPTKEMIAALVRRAGDSCDPTKAGLLHGGDLTRFLRGGCTWEDLEFAVDKLAASFAARGKRFSTWSLLEEHALDIRNRRMAGLPPPAPPVAFVRRPAVSNNGGYRSNGIRPMVATG